MGVGFNNHRTHPVVGDHDNTTADPSYAGPDVPATATGGASGALFYKIDHYLQVDWIAELATLGMTLFWFFGCFALMEALNFFSMNSDLIAKTPK